MSDSTPGRALHVSILSALDPADWASDAIATVTRAHFAARRSDVVLDLRTSSMFALWRGRAAWVPIAANWSMGADVVIVDHRIDSAARREAGIDERLAVIATTVFDDPIALVSEFAATLDRVAVDTRRRMLIHLGVLTDDDRPDATATVDRAIDALGGAITVTDRLIVAQHAGDGLTDPLLAALVRGSSEDAQSTRVEFDRLCDQIAEYSPTEATHSAALQRQVAALEVEADQLRDRADAVERHAVAALASAAARERALTGRIEAALIRAERTAS